MDHKLLDVPEMHALSCKVMEVLKKDIRFGAFVLLSKTKNYDPYELLMSGALVLDAYYNFLASKRCIIGDNNG